MNLNAILLRDHAPPLTEPLVDSYEHFKHFFVRRILSIFALYFIHFPKKLFSQPLGLPTPSTSSHVLVVKNKDWSGTTKFDGMRPNFIL